MILSPGSRLGPYEIVGPLGAGGMGEVYRARDSRLRRDVAIKILSRDFSADDTNQKRFLREAHAASALNHPNILVIHDIGQEEEQHYIVSELVQGESLRKLMEKGPVPVRKLLDIAVQIADGLAAAHHAGIVHRDLKPENIMITGDGNVKILDFGLAKVVPAEAKAEEETQSLTLTQSGVIHGTVPYMSPEQASGETVDYRSDQFSFGLILYEMACGRRAFQRNTSAQTLAAIIQEEPEPVSTLSPQTPAPLQWLIARCLAKEPRQRYESTRDLFRTLSDIRQHLSASGPSTSAPTPTGKKNRARAIHLLLLGGLGLLIAFSAFFLGKSSGFKIGHQTADRPYPLFQRLTFQRGFINTARFTKDGNTVVYSASWGNNPVSLYVTRLDSPESLSLTLPPAELFSVSTNGELALALPGSILGRVPLGGGAPREVLENVKSGDWAPGGQELAVVRSVNGLDRIEFPIGKVIYETPGGINSMRVSPHGDRVAFVEQPTNGAPVVTVVDRSSVKKSYTGKWVAAGGLAWTPDGQEIVFSFLENRSTSGMGCFTLAGQFRLLSRMDGYMGLSDISSKGDYLLIRNNFRREARGITDGAAEERDFSWLNQSDVAGLSADGHSLMIAEGRTIFLRKSDGSPAVKLGEGTPLALSPDGKFALTVSPNSPQQLVLLPTGAGEAKPLEPGKITGYDFAGFFPDGNRIVISATEPGHSWRLYVQDLAGGLPRPFTPEGVFTFKSAPVSPDGKWIAGVASTLQGVSFNLYSVTGSEVRPLPGITSTETVLRWTPDGQGLFVSDLNHVPASIYRMDLSSGKKELWKQISLPDPAGVGGLVSLLITPDAKSYYYSYSRRLSELYLATDLK